MFHGAGMLLSSVCGSESRTVYLGREHRRILVLPDRFSRFGSRIKIVSQVEVQFSWRALHFEQKYEDANQPDEAYCLADIEVGLLEERGCVASEIVLCYFGYVFQM